MSVILGGQTQPGQPAHNAKPVAPEYGWLTPLRKSAGDVRLWSFRCRCGAVFYREIGQVRRNEKNGVLNKCNRSCLHSE